MFHQAKKIDLTPTGLLMEGVYTHRPSLACRPPSLRRLRLLSYAVSRAGEAGQSQIRRGTWWRGGGIFQKSSIPLIGRDGEVDGDFSLGFDSLAAFEVRAEVPLSNGVFGCRGQYLRTAHHAKILDDSIFSNQRLQDYRSLHFHLPREQWIIRSNRVSHNLGSVGGHLHVLGGIVRDAGGGLGIRTRFCNGLRGRAGLQIHSHGTAAWADGAVSVAGNYLDFERGQHGTGGGCVRGRGGSRRSCGLTLGHGLMFWLGHCSGFSLGCRRGRLRSDTRARGRRILGLFGICVRRVRKPKIALVPKRDTQSNQQQGERSKHQLALFELIGCACPRLR
jgi:hypothetical protein